MAVSWPTARDLMSARPTTIPNDAPISRALGLMSSKHFHELPVLRRRQLVGMITMESIARRTNVTTSTKVENLMVLPPFLKEDTPYPEVAEQLLSAGIRAAPVVGRHNELLGIISRTDLVRVLPTLSGIADHRVEDIASPVGLVLAERDRVESILSHMRLLEEHPVPVADNKGRLVGAVGVADLSRVFWRPRLGGKRDAPRHDARTRHTFDVDVGTIMHSPAVTVPRGTSASVAARVMTQAKVSSAFVLEDGRAIGVVSQADLLGLAIGAGVRPGGVRTTSDVYVQIHGLRGNSDPETLAEIDRVVAQGLRRLSRHVHPVLLSLHIAPQGTHRSGDATVQARLHTDKGIFYASDTEWNYFAGIAALMDELGEQVRRVKDGPRGRGRHARDAEGTDSDESLGDPELEERIRAAAPEPRRRRR
jgi:CBS domain-containing protein/ribosome-associated translation inhibitor RaiA